MGTAGIRGEAVKRDLTWWGAQVVVLAAGGIADHHGRVPWFVAMILFVIAAQVLDTQRRDP